VVLKGTCDIVSVFKGLLSLISNRFVLMVGGGSIVIVKCSYYSQLL